MDPHLSSYARLLKRGHLRHIGAFLVFTFIYNVVFLPNNAMAAETGARVYNQPIIKSPESEVVNTFVALTSTPAASAATQADNRPAIAKSFEFIETVPFPAQPVKPLESQSRTVAGPSGSAAVSGPRERIVTLTAYNSESAQTDASPCITATGFNVCQHGIEDTVAANFLPFGTRIMIPDYFGERVFIVRDRTARKYGDRVDIWMLQKKDALNFGKRRLRVVILD